MEIPEFQADGNLPPGIHAASLADVEARFGGTPVRERQLGLMREVVTAAAPYKSIKRVLVWGSFVTSKPEPRDLDYSVVVSSEHFRTSVAPEHRRFLAPIDARIYYGVDRNRLVITDFPVELYSEPVYFVCETREGTQRGIIEISLRGEYPEEHHD
jgi:hypothetical protein